MEVSCSHHLTQTGRGLASLQNKDKIQRQSEVRSVITKLKDEIEKLKFSAGDHDDYFDLTAYLGPHYTSMYFLSLEWSGEWSADLNTNSKYQNIAKDFSKLLYTLQLPNGSWYRVIDKNLLDPGDLSATVINYWFLKSIGEDQNSAQMKMAREYILVNGGIKKVDMLTKIFLALFGNYSWKKIPSIPYLIFNKYSPVNVGNFGAWMGPHIMPIAILKNIQAQKNISPLLSLSELQGELQGESQEETQASSTPFPQRLSNSDKVMLTRLTKLQRPRGSWGGYVIASIFSKMALNLYLSIEKKGEDRDSVANANIKAQSFLDNMLFFPKANRFLGATQDGHIWDTALLTGALIDGGTLPDEVSSLTNHLKKFQRPNGGFPFGHDFENTPDVDDTAEIISTFSRINKDGRFNESIYHAIHYLQKMQNSDGGFGAFSKNNNGNFLLTYLTKDFLDSADLYDESSPDVTGHVLEALGKSGAIQVQDSPIVKKAINYLKKSQLPEGSFEGRWAINYIYGTSAAIVGLTSVGISTEDSMVIKATEWLSKQQNVDGGFGEGSLSYRYQEQRGVGISTPTQTAWALIALLKVLPSNDPIILNAVDFLINDFKREKTFIDQSVTGTGHPNACYMVYPSYPKAFPLTALSNFLKIY